MAIELVPGVFVGERELLAPAGAGGFSVVWKARDHGTGDLVAIKVPLVERLLEHLRQEASLTGRVSDPQLVPVLEANLADDPPHLVMPWIEGEPLPLPDGVPEPAQVMIGLERLHDLVGVVERLHAAGVVHGDLKPGNVLLDGEGRVQVCDLGLARLQVATNLERSLAQSVVSVDGRSIAGTLDYMAPELFERQEPSPRSDLYALGVLLHHLLTGRPPAFGVAPDELNPYLPPGAAGLVRWLLQPDPARRAPSAAPVRQALAQLVLTERRCLARPNGHARRRVFLRRMKVLRRGLRALAVAALGAALVLVALLGTLRIEGFSYPGGPGGMIALLVFANPLVWIGVVLGITTINAWIAGVPDGVYKNRPGHRIWTFMMQ